MSCSSSPPVRPQSLLVTTIDGLARLRVGEEDRVLALLDADYA